mgnify:CR=1 FL=1
MRSNFIRAISRIFVSLCVVAAVVRVSVLQRVRFGFKVQWWSMMLLACCLLLGIMSACWRRVCGCLQILSEFLFFIDVRLQAWFGAPSSLDPWLGLHAGLNFHALNPQSVCTSHLFICSSFNHVISQIFVLCVVVAAVSSGRSNPIAGNARDAWQPRSRFGCRWQAQIHSQP